LLVACRPSSDCARSARPRAADAQPSAVACVRSTPISAPATPARAAAPSASSPPAASVTCSRLATAEATSRTNAAERPASPSAVFSGAHATCPPDVCSSAAAASGVEVTLASARAA
jgi:hypothetical protein